VIDHREGALAHPGADPRDLEHRKVDAGRRLIERRRLLRVRAGRQRHRAYDELSARGVEFVEQHEERPYGIDSGFRDPSGNHLRLTQVREIAAA
jgi:hypothetical protein